MPHAFGGPCSFLLEDAGATSVPRDDEDRPRGTTQNAFRYRSLSQAAPSSSSIGTENDDIDIPGVCVKHDQPSRITVLLLNAHLYACRLCALAKLGEVLEPLARAPGEWKVRRGCVKEKQLRLADHRETERTVERSFARLLKIDCAENAPKGLHAVHLQAELPPERMIRIRSALNNLWGGNVNFRFQRAMHRTHLCDFR